MTTSNILWAEAWGFLAGLCIARDLRIQKLVVETDSMVLVEVIKKGHSQNPALQFILKEILALIRRKDRQVNVFFIPRSANRCADILAQKGHSSSFVICRVSLSCVMSLLQDDNRYVGSHNSV